MWMAGSEALSGNELRRLVLGLARPLRRRTPERRQLGIQPLPPSPLPSSYCQSAHCRYARAESCLGRSHRENIIKKTLLAYLRILAWGHKEDIEAKSSLLRAKAE